jgi:tripartite-type tricarboxylate transporter receptor subunit TctC
MYKLSRRRFVHLAAAAAAAALPFAPRVASAQTYPTRPVRIIVGFAAGGITDITARLIGQWLSSRVGQPFVIENRPGAGGNLATEAVVRARPDGYTLLQSSAPNSFNETLYANLSFNFVRDIVPVATILRSVGVMEVNLSVPARTGPEFIAYAKANPGKISMATGGLGSGPHVFGELFKKMTGLDLLTVHYRGTGPAIPDLIGGQVQVMFDLAASSVELIRAGRLRPLGVTTATRIDALPDVPPIADFVPGYEASAWQGIGAPKNTPVEIIDKLNKEINAALADPAFRARLIDLGASPFATSPAEFSQFTVEFTEKWAKIIRAANIKAE